jgi:hypothetical protein
MAEVKHIPTFRYCLHCKGTGHVHEPATWIGEAEWVFCPDCLANGFCPRCLKRGWKYETVMGEDTDEVDDVPCGVCGWDWNRGEMDNQLPKVKG